MKVAARLIRLIQKYYLEHRGVLPNLVLVGQSEWEELIPDWRTQVFGDKTHFAGIEIVAVEREHWMSVANNTME